VGVVVKPRPTVVKGDDAMLARKREMPLRNIMEKRSHIYSETVGTYSTCSECRDSVVSGERIVAALAAQEFGF